jgi:hypothetical protein
MEEQNSAKTPLKNDGKESSELLENKKPIEQ